MTSIEPMANTRSLAILAAACFTVPASAGDVLVVDPGQAGAFAHLPIAVAAAADGDIVLVRPGSYSGTVTVDGLGVTIVGEGAVRLDGRIEISNVPAESEVLIGGLTVFGPDNRGEPAVEAVNCSGSVRVVDCELTGSLDDFNGIVLGRVGPGAEVSGCAEVAIIDSVLRGGQPTVYGGLTFGQNYKGGAGLVADQVRQLTLMRSVLRGNMGSSDIFGVGGDGGDGAVLTAVTSAHIAYSGFFGGPGGIGDANPGAPSGTGGTGLVASGSGTLFNFAGLFVAGEEGCFNGFFCNPGAPGAESDISMTVVPLSGFPNAVQAPLVVRRNDPYDVKIFASAGQRSFLWQGTEPGFAFRRSGRQPLLLERPFFGASGGAGLIGPEGELDTTLIAVLPPALGDGRVIWIQGAVRDTTGPARLTSARPVVVLSQSF